MIHTNIAFTNAPVCVGHMALQLRNFRGAVARYARTASARRPASAWSFSSNSYTSQYNATHPSVADRHAIRDATLRSHDGSVWFVDEAIFVGPEVELKVEQTAMHANVGATAVTAVVASPDSIVVTTENNHTTVAMDLQIETANCASVGELTAEAPSAMALAAATAERLSVASAIVRGDLALTLPAFNAKGHQGMGTDTTIGGAVYTTTVDLLATASAHVPVAGIAALANAPSYLCLHSVDSCRSPHVNYARPTQSLYLSVMRLAHCVARPT